MNLFLANNSTAVSSVRDLQSILHHLFQSNCAQQKPVFPLKLNGNKFTTINASNKSNKDDVIIMCYSSECKTISDTKLYGISVASMQRCVVYHIKTHICFIKFM